MRPRGGEKMSLLRKLFARKALDGLLEISDRIYVLNCCLSSETLREEQHRENLSSIIIQLRNFYNDASFMVLNFMEGDVRTSALDALSHFGITVSDYPSQFQNCPLLPLTLIQHFLKSTERWLPSDRHSNNMILLHCEKGAWPLLAFMLSSILVFKKEANCENKTLEMVYKRVAKEMMQLHLELNPQPSHLRYLQYVEKLRGSSDFSEQQFFLDCVILRSIPNFDGEKGCRPVIQVYGTDPSDRRSKILFRSPISKKEIKYYKQGERHTVIKLNTECHIQGDVVIECVHLTKDDLSRKEIMFRFIFNTAFVQSNMVTFTRDELDIAWNGKDKFQEDFKVEVFFSDIIVSEPETPTKETIIDDSHEIQSVATEGTRDEFFDAEEIVKEQKPISKYPFKTLVEDDVITESDIHVIESSSYRQPDIKSTLSNLTNDMRCEMSDIHVVRSGSIGEGEREKSREMKRHSQKSILSSKILLPIRGTKKNSVTPKNLTKPNLNVESKVARIIHGERNLTQSPSMSPRRLHSTTLATSSRRTSLDGSIPSFVTPLHPQLPRVKIRVADARQQKPARSISANLVHASPKSASALAASPHATPPRFPRTASLHSNKDVMRSSNVLSRTSSSVGTSGYYTPPHPSQIKNVVMSPRMVSRPRVGAGTASTKFAQQNQDGIKRSVSVPRATSAPKTRARAI